MLCLILGKFKKKKKKIVNMIIRKEKDKKNYKFFSYFLVHENIKRKKY